MPGDHRLPDDGDGVTMLPSGLVTFLFTDIEGSTRLFRTLGDNYIPLLERHHHLLRAAWNHHRGVEVKTEGDAFLVAFASAQDAVAAAVAAQRAITDEPWSTPEPLRVRIGIHSGLAAPRGGDYIAYAVHQAARVVGAAHGGQIILTEDTVRAADGIRTELTSLGRFRVRDFEHPVELYRAVVPGLADDPRPPRATPAMGHNLTEPATRFVGRTSDLDELAHRVVSGQLLTIVGPGGAGKTRLVTELGLRIAPEWNDGVWLAELAAVSADAGIAGTLADAMRVATSNRDPLEAIAEEYRTRAAVVVLDNCEHVVEAAAHLAGDLLRRVPSLAVLATSREPLGLAHEQVWRLGPLAAESDSIDLFVDRAFPGVDPPMVDGVDRVAIREICARLDGNPLAIELAAARVADVGLAALRSSLDDRFRVLRSRRRDLDPRQRSMTAVLDWSHDLLEAEEQIVFRRLGAFRDTFDLDGAEVAAVDAALDLGQSIDAVWAMVDQSLLTVDGAAGETRFLMSETVRTYARERLRDAAEVGEVTGRLGRWYRERFGPWTAMGAAEIGEMRLELDNIRSVVDDLATLDQETAQRLAVAIAYYLDVSGQPVEGVVEVNTLLRRLPEPSPMRAMLLVGAARLRGRLGDHDVDSLLEEAQRLLDEAGPEPEWATGSLAMMRAFTLAARGDTAGALSIAEALTAGDAPPGARARGYNGIGIIKGSAGDIEGAFEAHERGLAVELRLGQPIEIAVGHNNVAEYAMRLGRIDEAAHHQLATLELAAQVGSTVLIAFSLVIAARVAAARNEWTDAVRLQGAAERRLDESGYQLTEDEAELSTTMLATAEERLGEAYEPAWRAGQASSVGEAVEAAGTTLRRAAG